MKPAAILFLLALFVAPSAALAYDINGVPVVTDADTVRIGDVRIRLNGIDAPETDQVCNRDGQDWMCGQAATAALIEFLDGRSISCLGQTEDRYGRVIATCYVGSSNINSWLVRRGWAVAYRRYSNQYTPEEAAARSERLNLWSGQFDMPWDWRRR